MPPRATARAALLTGLVLGAGLVPGVAHAAPGSTVTVTSCTESALRAAITDAPDGGTVQIACDDPILLTPGGGSTVVVDKTLTISGTGHDAVIDGGQQTSLFAVQAPAGATSPADLPIVTFRDLTLTRGWAQDTGSLGGGAIWSAGHIVVERVDFTDNHAFNRGGAILGLAFGSTTVVDSTFTGNSVTCPLDGSGGGAIAVRQRNATSITGSTFTGNSATGAASGGAVLAWVHEGYSGFPAEPPPFPPSPSPFATDLVITGSTFTDNRVTVGGSAALDRDRMYGGGALASFDHPLQVTDSLFEGNTVESIVGYGGAVFAASFRGTPTTLTTVDVLSNGFPDRVGQFVANGIGGGVALQGTPSTVDDTIIDGNRAFVGGGLYTRGAPVEVVDSSIDENTAGAVNPGASNHGGGLATQGPVTLTNSQLLGNLGGTCALFHPDVMTLPTGDVVTDGGDNDIEGRASCFRPAVPPTSPPATGALTSPSAPTPPGDPVSLAGSGFAPHTRVTLVAYPLTVAAAAPGTAAAAPGAVDLGSAAADGAGLVIVSSVLPGAGVWRVLALGTSPSGTTVSLEAVVLVAAAGTDVAPAVVSQPASATGAVGTTVTLTATAAGSPAPTVQWQRSTDGSTWSDEPGATGTSLAVAVPAGSASYRAVFSNAAGTVVSAVAVVSGPAGAPGGGSGGGSGSGSGGGSGSGSTGGGADPVVDGSAAVPGVPGVAVGGAVLARTGADVLPVLATGAALVLAGALLVRFARRRRQEP